MHSFVKIFLAVWFAGVVTIGGFIFMSSIGQALSVDGGDNSHTNIGIIVPPILLAFGVLLVRFGKRLGRGGRNIHPDVAEKLLRRHKSEPVAEMIILAPD